MKNLIEKYTKEVDRLTHEVNYIHSDVLRDRMQIEISIYNRVLDDLEKQEPFAYVISDNNE